MNLRQEIRLIEPTCTGSRIACLQAMTSLEKVEGGNLRRNRAIIFGQYIPFISFNAIGWKYVVESSSLYNLE
jgi:hypothetical protein